MIPVIAQRFRPAPPLLWAQRPWFAVAAVLLVAGDAVFWLMFLAVQSDSGLALLDSPVHSWIVEWRNPVATALLAAVTTVTSPWWMTLIGVAVAGAWAFWKREIWRPSMLLGAMAVTVALSTFIKHQVGRARPPSADFLLGPDDALSFPSGHTLGTGVFLFVLAYLLLSRSATRTTAVCGVAAAVAVTLLVAVSRLYLGYHWLTDVVASLGVALAVTGVAVFVDGAVKGRRD